MDEERGISLKEIFSVIFKRVWWLVGCVAAFAIIVVLFVQFYYNPSKRTYTIDYTIEYPDSASGQYPDGTAFRLSDIKSLATLEYIKSTDESFASIDVSKMIDNDDISITKVTDSTTDDEYVELTIKKRYFSSTEQAQKFIKAVAEFPAEYVKELVESSEYTANLTAFNVARTYEDQISLLEAQLSYVNGMYDSLINLYGQYYKVNGKSLLSYRLELNNVLSSEDLLHLNSELTNQRYVKDGETFLANAQSDIDAYNKQIAYNNKRIEALREERDKISGSQSDVETFNKAILDLVASNSTLQYNIDIINEKVASINNTDTTAQKAFEEKLEGYVSDLNEATDVFKSVRIAVYAEKSVTVYNSNNIEVSGGLNIILAAVVGAVVGFIVAGVIICIIDMPKYLRKRDAELAATATPKTEE
jgi:hypothetical protein